MNRHAYEQRDDDVEIGQGEGKPGGDVWYTVALAVL